MILWEKHQSDFVQFWICFSKVGDLHKFEVILQLLWPQRLQISKQNEIRPTPFSDVLKNNWARVSAYVCRWLSRRDRNIARNITLAHNASFSYWFWSVLIDFRKNYVITFFILNLTSYIFWLDFFSVSRLGTKLNQVIGKKPDFSRTNGNVSNFVYVVQRVMIYDSAKKNLFILFRIY